MISWLASFRTHRTGAVVTVLVLFAWVAVASAYFRSTGSGTASASAGSLSAPTGVTATAGAGTAVLHWNAVTPPASGPVTYYVTRSGGAPAGNCPTSTSPTGVTTCTDSGLAAGSYSYTVTAVWQSWTATSSPATNVTLASGAASKIVLSGATTGLVSGTTRIFTATVEDAAGNTVTSGPDAGASITFAQTTGAGTVTGLGTTAAVSGVATDTITGRLAGSITLRANGTINATPTNSNTQTFTVTFGTASQIVLSGATASLASGTTRAFTATIQDAAGNTITSGTDAGASITFGQTTGAGTVTGLGTTAAVSGVATDTITGKLAGSVTLRANGTINATPTNSNTQTFTVIAGAATQIAIVSGSGQSASTGSAFTNPLVAVVEDAAGNPVSGVPVTFTGPSSGASGSFATCAGGNPTSYECVVTTNSSGDATASTFTANATAGSYNVTAGASGTTTANFALSNVGNVLVITSAPVSGAASSKANLGPITVQQQTTGGTPVNAGSGGLTVNLSGPAGSSFAASQFGTSVTSVTIPAGSSSATFWYANSSTGTPTITAAASGLVSGTQKETITTAPAGLGIVVVGGTGTPVAACGTPSSSYTCAVTGVGSGGNVTFYVTFVNSSGTQVVYSSAQSSTINETGQNTGSVTIAANASSSNPNTLTASHTGASTKTSTLTFGPYTLTITVDS